ncbi:MAG: hypothetical protein J6W02_08940 [Bacteroidaceae bacterium]|nr:hypothetical protein [Bacteroidaceae bacterium]
MKSGKDEGWTEGGTFGDGGGNEGWALRMKDGPKAEPSGTVAGMLMNWKWIGSRS